MPKMANEEAEHVQSHIHPALDRSAGKPILREVNVAKTTPTPHSEAGGEGCGEGLPSDQVWAPSDDGGGGVVVVVVEVVVASEGGLRWQLLSSSTGLVGSSSVHLLQTGHDEEGEVGNTGPSQEVRGVGAGRNSGRTVLRLLLDHTK